MQDLGHFVVLFAERFLEDRQSVVAPVPSNCTSESDSATKPLLLLLLLLLT
jgi:hypothetical protein